MAQLEVINHSMWALLLITCQTFIKQTKCVLYTSEYKIYQIPSQILSSRIVFRPPDMYSDVSM